MNALAVVWLAIVLFLLQTPTASQSADTGFITGRVVDGTTGAPVSRAIVSLTRAGGSTGNSQGAVQEERVLTDAAGRYFFSHVAKGSYVLSVTKPGWIAGAHGQRRPVGQTGGQNPISIEDAESKTDVKLMLWRHAVLSGVVLDEAGEPVVAVEVRAVRRELSAGRRRLAFATMTKTDDRGRFRLANLVPGEYFAMVPATVSSGSLTFGGAGASTPPPAYMQTMTAIGTAPSTVNRFSTMATGDGSSSIASSMSVVAAPSSDAVWFAYQTASSPVVALGAGQERSTDIQMKLVPTYQVSGEVIGPEGPAAGHAVHLLPAEESDYPLIDTAMAITEADGRFRMFGVPPGQYIARVVRSPLPDSSSRLSILTFADGTTRVSALPSGPTRPGAPPPPPPVDPLLHASERVAVSESHVRGVVLSLRPGPRVTGRAAFDGSAPPPTADQLMGLMIRLSAAGGYEPFRPQNGAFAADGSFATQTMPPGSYVLRMLNAPPGWYFKSATYEGKDISDVPVELQTDLSGVLVSFTDRKPVVQGTVQMPDGAAELDATVLLFPADKTHWTDYGSLSRRMISARVASNGKASINAPPDGLYFIVAIPEEDATDWQDPAFLTRLSAIAKQITVRGADTPPFTLRVEKVK